MVYAAMARCICSAGLAIEPSDPAPHWICSAIMLSETPPDGPHLDPLPFDYMPVLSEDDPAANGATTRPEP